MSIKQSGTNIEKIIDYSLLEAKEIDFLKQTISPELEKFNREQQQIILNRFRAVVENRNIYQSPFPTEKEYDRELINVEGIRKITDFSEQVRYLALGIISRKEEIVEKSYEFFQKEILLNFRDSASPERIFAALNGHLKGEPTSEKAQGILNVLSDKNYINNRILDNMIMFFEKGMGQKQLKLSSLVTRFNKRTIDLSRGNNRFGCCAFCGSGEGREEYQMNINSRYYSSILYLADPEIGLLFSHIDNKGSLSQPAGVMIMASMLGKEEEKKTEERYLLIDSVEAYRPDYVGSFPDHPLREMKADIWRRTFYNAIQPIAKDIGATKIFYNDDFWNEGGKTFTNFFLERADARKQKVLLVKEGSRSFIPDYYVDKFGFFFDCIMPPENYDGAHAIKGNLKGKGTAYGWVVDVE